MIEYDNNQTPVTPPKYKKLLQKKWLLIGAGVLLVVIVGFLSWYFLHDDSVEPIPPATTTIAPEPEPEPEPTVESVTNPFNAKKIAAALKNWTSTHKGVYAVVITDEDGKVLAEQNPSRSFFAASLYKLYVAYEGYRKIDDGTYKLSEPYLNGWTREKCLHEMIHQSHSPCAEKMWVELGKANLDAKMQKYGLKDTSMVGITTSSRDAATMLARIQSGEGLSKSSRQKYLTSMKTQIYRDGLPAGFVDQTVYDKVGFREKVEYHDVGIVKLEDGRVLIVSVLTENAGVTNIAGLATALLSATESSATP